MEVKILETYAAVLPPLAPFTGNICSQHHSTNALSSRAHYKGDLCVCGKLGKARMLTSLSSLPKLVLLQHIPSKPEESRSSQCWVLPLTLSEEPCHSLNQCSGILASSWLHLLSSFHPSAIFDLLQAHGICHSCDLLQELSLFRTQTTFPVRTPASITVSHLLTLCLVTDSTKDSTIHDSKEKMYVYINYWIYTHILVNILHHAYDLNM